MRMGLFGKTQSKRDFIALATPRAFLNVWEPWLQSSISASRMQLGERWNNAFLTAPIWRFWLGADICGMTAIGAIMPSMDGVGRYFPLTAASFGEEGAGPLPPEVDDNENWFAAVEDFLFSTLETGRPFEQITEALAALPVAQALSARLDPAVRTFGQYPGVLTPRGDGFAEAFGRSRQADPVEFNAGMSFWWTAGGKDFEPVAISTRRLPNPNLFASMLTGVFTDPPAGEAGS